jgi:Tfp pilus assembly protein PilE
MKTKSSQLGVTLTGLIMASIVLGVVALTIMKLWPVYNEKIKVDQAMAKLAGNPDGFRMTKMQMVNALMRQFDVSDVEDFDTPRLTKLLQVGRKKNSPNKVVMLAYEIRAPLVSNLDIVMNYKNVIEFGPAKTD